MRKIQLSELRFEDLHRPNEVIGWPQGPGEPLALTERLIEQGPALSSPALCFGLTQSDTLRPELANHFRFIPLNDAGTSRRVAAFADIIPRHISTVPALLRSGLLRVDIALIQTRPVSDGFSLGVIADFTRALIQQARLVIALVNPSLPATGGDTFVHPDDIDLLVDGDHRLIDMPDPLPSSVEREVARCVAELIPDRATVQLGIGTLPVAVAHALSDHRDLGAHSGVVSDSLVKLVELGVFTNAFKGIDSGLTVTGGLFGTDRLRDFAECTKLIAMRSADYTHDLGVTSMLSQFHTVNSVIEIDLSGQANAEMAGGRYLGAVGGLVDFVRAGAASKGGHSILAFPSTTPDGRHSRSDVDIVATEYGSAHLRGSSSTQRAKRLMAIAHPAHREALARALQDSCAAAPL